MSEPVSDWRPSAVVQHLHNRGQMLAQIREFFARRQVLEVQTPLLGKATVTDPEIEALAVRSGETLHGYLQTSTEYHQKRLLASGVGDNYTLGAVFRADEQGALHNPEFTMLEWYRLGFDDRMLMAELEQLVNELLGPGEYKTHSYSAVLERGTLSAAELADVMAADQEDLRLVRALETLGRGRHFVVDYPARHAVLARLDPEDTTIARRFELIIDGIEVANGYFELTDARGHRARFEIDNQHRAAKNRPTIEPDQALLAAIDAGLPECAGVAVGVDRLLMLRTGADSIAEVQAFSWSRR